MSWLLGILRRIIGVGEEEETRPTNSTNRTVPTTAAATAGNRAVPTTTGAANAGNRAVPTTTTASNRDYSPYNDTSSSRRYAPTTTTTATASNRAVPTTTTASYRDYSPYNDTSSSRRYAPTTTTTTTTAATLSYRDVLTTTTASNRDYSPYNDTSSSRRYAPTTTTTAATASNRVVPTTTTVSNRDYNPYNDTSSSRSHVSTTTTASATASNRNYSPYYDTSSTRSYVPTTTPTTTPTTYPHLTRQASDANTVTQNCTPSYSNSQNSTPTEFPGLLNFSFASSSKTVPSVSTPPSPPASSSSSSSGTPPSSPKPLRPSSKPFLSLAPSNPTHPNSKTAYIWVEQSTSPIYAIPKDIRDSIKKNVVPGILKRPLSPSTYRDYFEALLYAEDFYLEKWDGFEMKNVTLELHEAAIYKRTYKYNKNADDEKDDKVFVTFELDSIPERRPFLLSRDFVSVRPSGTNAEPFQGLIYRVVKSNRVLVDFGEDFHDQHYSACKYNVKFSFNRVCLKRAHQAIATASCPLFRNFLFPDSISKNSLTAQLQSINSNLNSKQVSAVRQILSHQNAIPYLVEGPVSVSNWSLSKTGFVVYEAVLQVYRTFPSCRILICAPTNNACDAITTNLKENIQESDIFRANAAFREFDGVPEDILPSCHYEEERECFAFPSVEELRKFKVISSTFMSSFRLHNEGIMAGHFSHIFLVDASSVIEPEAMVPLANLANENTAVTITGTPGNHSGWIHSHIARQNGLLKSYFERLWESKLYESLDPKLITQL